jgi:hypothetical protein
MRDFRATAKMRFPTQPGVMGHYVVFIVAGPGAMEPVDPFSFKDSDQTKQIHDWLADNAAGTYRLAPQGVIFDNEDDAVFCFMAFR